MLRCRSQARRGFSSRGHRRSLRSCSSSKPRSQLGRRPCGRLCRSGKPGRLWCNHRTRCSVPAECPPTSTAWTRWGRTARCSTRLFSTRGSSGSGTPTRRAQAHWSFCMFGIYDSDVPLANGAARSVVSGYLLIRWPWCLVWPPLGRGCGRVTAAAGVFLGANRPPSSGNPTIAVRGCSPLYSLSRGPGCRVGREARRCARRPTPF